MTLSDQLLAALALYGLPVLFSVNVFTSLGVPIPGSFLLIAAGAFAEQGQLSMPWVIFIATLGAVAGDNAGFLLGHWGGRGLAWRIAGWLRIQTRMPSIEAFAQKWGAAGIFFSRWLLGAIGPPLNLIFGMIAYPYLRFLVWDIAGELLGVVLYVAGGYLFSENIETLINLLGSLGWAAAGLVVALLIGWRLLRYFRKKAN